MNCDGNYVVSEAVRWPLIAVLRVPAPHNRRRHRRNQTGWVQGSRHQERRKGAASLQVRPMMELGNVEATKRIVGAGLGWSIVPSTAIRGDTDTTILVRRLKPSLKRQLGMVLRQDKVRDPPMRATIAAFEQLVR